MAIRKGRKIQVPEGKGQTPTTQSPLAGAFKHFGMGDTPETAYGNVLRKDDDRIRRAMIDLEVTLYDVLHKSFEPRLNEAKKFFEPGQAQIYTQEERQRRAHEAIKPALAKYEEAMKAELVKHIKALEDADLLVVEALDPDTEKGRGIIAEIRAREVREALLGMNGADRTKFLFDSGMKAALEVLHAVKSDPMKRTFADEKALAGASIEAIKAQDGGPELLEYWQFRKDALVSAGVRAQLMDMGIAQGLQHVGLSFRYPPNQWQVMVNEALAKSEKALV